MTKTTSFLSIYISITYISVIFSRNVHLQKAKYTYQYNET